MIISSKKTPPATFAVTESMLKELNDKFARLVRQLGTSNKKGSHRYDFEVEFAYAFNELAMAPLYIQGKMYDKASAVITSLVNFIKTRDAPGTVGTVGAAMLLQSA